MAEFKLDRFKYIWRGDWTSGEVYNRDDIVRVKGKSYVCLVQHTAAVNFRTDLDFIVPGSNPPLPAPKWRVMTSGKSFIGEWETSTVYDLGDIVYYQGGLYQCAINHTSGVFSNQFANWTPVGEHIDFIGNWTNGTDYAPGAVVKYNGIVYKCIAAHTAGGLLEDNISSWSVFFNGIDFKGDFETSTLYRKNDLVKSGGTLWICTETHTSGNDDVDLTKFDLYLPGFQFNGEWDDSTYYQTGDVVIYSGNAYYALQNNVNNEPFTTELNSNWLKLASSYNFKGNYNLSANYKPGDVVHRGGNLYIALSQVEQNDGSTNDFLDTSTWQLFKPGIKWSSTWQLNRQYYPGELVIYKGSNYKCVIQHVSTNNNFPGDNGSGFDYWEIFIPAGLEAGLETIGDLLTYGLNRTEVGDLSSKGPTNVQIGNFEQFLSVNSDFELFYRNWIEDSDVVYVSTDGLDIPGRGLSAEKPFASIQYAADYVYHNYTPLTPVSIRVSTGRYYETLPITIPAGCVVNGDELRSTTIQAADADPDYVNDWLGAQNYFVRLSAILPNILTLNTVTPLSSNTKTQVINNLVASDPSVVTQAQNIIDNVVEYVEFYILESGTEPTMFGSNTENQDSDIANAVNILLANKDFITEEMLLFRDQIVGTNYDRIKATRDVHAWINSLIWDLKFTSNFKSLRSSEVYKNRILGSTVGVNMFYCRDTTGVRDLTVDGLTGTVADGFAAFTRPTGGAYCSLDPGWGTDDENVWIVNRSPYIQGVTTLGNFAIGQKVDGSLHAGGNKSMVSNDFTQVISDGIGAWVTNGARAELVSVFTYYAQIGYLAEAGGIIRATNGNNSYGRFGAVADGIDPTETPASASVFNRNNEAVVRSVFAGEFQDIIFGFEYAHCGEEYTQATAEIVGAGGGAAVIFDDFRDGGIKQVRLTVLDSGLPGGSGYSVVQNNAQSGDTTSITLAASDTGTANSYTNMRIVINSGDGTGQYGVVQSYNPSTKVLNVIKETTGEAGWDHIIAGTPIEASLSNNAVYRIEPRIEVSDPGFINLNYELPNIRTFTDMTHGDTSETFTNLAATLGTGEVDISIVPSAATFNVERNGKNYELTLVDGGAGYAVGDNLTITGDNLGGSSPENDCTIIVTAVSNDSTNEITGFTSLGVGLSGIFVAVALPNFIVYSNDGSDFTETFVSQTANWIRVVNGNSRFIIVANDSNKVGVSLDGINYTFYNLPITETFSDMAFGEGRFVIIAENTNTVLTSANGITWTQRTIPDDLLGDSTASQWQKIAYGAGRFVAIAGNDRAVAYSDDSITWTRLDTALPAGDFDWISLTYGKNRWLAVDRNGATAYSIDNGLTWSQGPDMPSQDGSTSMIWEQVKYDNGIWFGVCNTGGKIMGDDPTFTVTRYCATSNDGYHWIDRQFSDEQEYKVLAYANISNVPTWVVLADNVDTDGVVNVFTGSRGLFRPTVTGSQISEIKIFDPGSGYVEGQNDPTLTIYDNTFNSAVLYDLRLGNGVLAQPSFTNRGTGYRTSSTRVSITGNGFADIIPESNFVTLRGLANLPGPGAQFRFATILDTTTDDPTDLKVYTVSTVTDLGDDGLNANTKLAQFRITPRLEIQDNLETGTTVEIRESYSQCRVTGHDFLDIGTGNFEETNYPDIYASGQFFVYAPENEVFEINGGRVFYTSTDQSGNFRGGELFAVEQATGIVTISAEFFSLDGLSELALGGVRLGGSGTVVREFSTDVTFTEDSNNVIPTQRAIITFFNNRLSQGGSEIATNNLQAGNVLIGTQDNRIDVTVGQLNFPKKINISGAGTGIEGSILAYTMFYRDPFVE